MSQAAVLWSRGDLRLTDNPAVNAAAGRIGVVPLFVLDPALLGPAGGPRTAFLCRYLRALEESMGGRLVMRRGDPVAVVPQVALEAGAGEVVVSADFGPYGRRRDQALADALRGDGRRLAGVGSPYAVDPGRARKQDGSPFPVFSPFYRAWRAHSWPPPGPAPASAGWVQGIQSDPPLEATTLPPAGEAAALVRLDALPIDDYARDRDRPAAAGTSRLSPYLKYGCIHPRTILARLGRSKWHEKVRSELAWREFYADVLWHRPESARRSLQPAMAKMKVDTGKAADERFQAWAEGGRVTRWSTRYAPAPRRGVDSQPGADGRRQLPRQGPPHRLDKRRPLVHAPPGGRRPGLEQPELAVGGRDGHRAGPYFRVFNPTTQAQDHDPAGDYVRRWLPELAGVPGKPPAGYPPPVVDPATERAEAIFRYESLKSRP